MKIAFDVSKRKAMYAAAAIALVVSSGLVVAYGTSNPQLFGHSAGEIQGLVGLCPDGQFMKGFNADGTRNCAAAPTGGSGTSVELSEEFTCNSNAPNRRCTIGSVQEWAYCFEIPKRSHDDRNRNLCDVTWTNPNWVLHVSDPGKDGLITCTARCIKQTI